MKYYVKSALSMCCLINFNDHYALNALQGRHSRDPQAPSQQDPESDCGEEGTSQEEGSGQHHQGDRCLRATDQPESASRRGDAGRTVSVHYTSYLNLFACRPHENTV